MNIKVIAFDLDGTALNSKKELTKPVSDAIETAIKQGITVLPATGRQISGIPTEIFEVTGLQYAISANGARITNLKTETTIHKDFISTALSKELLKQFREFNCFVSMYIEDKSYSDNRVPAESLGSASDVRIVEYLKATRTLVDDIESFYDGFCKPVEKFSIHFACLDERARFLQAFEKRTDIAITSSLDNNVEINSASANKGDALLILAKHLGYAKNQTMAIGDNINDLTMLKSAGCGVAMRNGSPEALAAADVITKKTCDEHGVAEAIFMAINN